MSSFQLNSSTSSQLFVRAVNGVIVDYSMPRASTKGVHWNRFGAAKVAAETIRRPSRTDGGRGGARASRADRALCINKGAPTIENVTVRAIGFSAQNALMSEELFLCAQRNRHGTNSGPIHLAAVANSDTRRRHECEWRPSRPVPRRRSRSARFHDSAKWKE